MFEKKGEFYTNKDDEFLKSSDLVIYWKAKPKKLIKNYVVIGGSDEHSKVDIPRADKDLALLLARLAMYLGCMMIDLKIVKSLKILLMY